MTLLRVAPPTRPVFAHVRPRGPRRGDRQCARERRENRYWTEKMKPLRGVFVISRSRIGVEHTEHDLRVWQEAMRS